MDFGNEKTAKICHVRKKSVEIPLENLLSGVVFLSGGRDVRGGPVLSLVNPTDPDVDVEALMEMTESDFVDMISYFTFVPSEEVRSKKFSVAMVTDKFHDFLLRTAIKSLNSFHQSNPELIHAVYFVGSNRTTSVSLLDWAYNSDCVSDPVNRPATDLPYVIVPTMPELYQYINKDQLTHEFDGTLQYKHQDWVRFRMQVEPFICDVVGVSKRLAQAVAPFTDEHLPETLHEAEESLKAHHLERRKTLETLHVEELTSEGERIRKKMNSPSQQQFRDNPDFVATLDTIEVLMNRVENVRTRLENLWETRQSKLEANFKQKKFENEANQVIDWFEQYAEEFFETHNEIGDSKQVVMAMVSELEEFETSTKQILSKTSRLLKNAKELHAEENGEEEEDQFIAGLTSKIKDLTKDFTSRLNSRKRLLNNNLKLHDIMNKAIDWCIEGVSFLSDYDCMSTSMEDVNAAEWKEKFVEFQDLCPPPTREEIALLNEMVASPDAIKGKEGFQFALNRILEVHQRFELYHRMLDEMIEEKKGGSSLEPVNEVVQEPVDVPDLAGTPPQSLGLEPPLDARMERRGTINLVDPMQALTILDKTAQAADPDQCEECVSLMDFLSELGDSDNDEIRSRSGSNVFDKVSLSGEHNRLSKAGISGPLDAKFTDDPETVSLDDTRIEEPEDMAAQTQIAKHRRLLMEELLQTEEVYIRDLEHLCAHYMPSMDNVNDLPKCLIGKKHVLFGYLPTILEFNKDVILPQLRKCSKAPIKMGLVFLEHEEEFYHYAKYFKNKPAQDHLMGLGDAIQFFRVIQENVDDSLPLLAHLIKPVQRIIKYKQFLEQMIKYSSKGKEQQGVQKGAKKEYFDKLKEALKMVDFVLRHGNDLLALESLKGYEGSLAEQGRVLRVGVLTVIDGFSKHRRKVFLFEHCLIFAKIRKTSKSGPTGTEEYEFRHFYRTNSLVLRENVPGHETRFALEMKKTKLELQADTMEEKMEWVTEIWDLFFSHMLKLRDENLQSYGTKAISTLINSGTATLTRGRALGHSSRRIRLSTVSDTRRNREAKSKTARPISTASVSSIGSASSLELDIALLKQTREMGFSPPSHSPTSPRPFISSEIKRARVSQLSSEGMSASAASISTMGSVNSISTMGSAISNGMRDPEETLRADSTSMLSSSSSSSFVENDKPMFTTPL